LLRTIVYDDATLAQRRAVHLLLTQILDPETQPLRYSLHLAAVSEGPDSGLADALARAAATQGSPRAAASRALERAADLTTDPVVAATHLVAARQAGGRQAHRAGCCRVGQRHPSARQCQSDSCSADRLRAGRSRTPGTCSRLLAICQTGRAERDDAVARPLPTRRVPAPGRGPAGSGAAPARNPRRSCCSTARMTAMFQGNHEVGMAALCVAALADELHDAVALIRQHGRGRVGTTPEAPVGPRRQRRSIDRGRVERPAGRAAAGSPSAGTRRPGHTARPLARATGRESLASNVSARSPSPAWPAAGTRFGGARARAHGRTGVTRAGPIDWALSGR
jgi:hypothetical protein